MKTFHSFSKIQDALKNKTITCKEIVQNYLSTIEKKKHLNAFIEVFDIESLQQAELIDEKLSHNVAGRLAGMVISIKDVLCYEGHRLQAGSKILEGFISPYTATAVQRLLDEDAIIIGRTNCDEFAMGSSSESSIFGSVKNPIHSEYVAGGSSGGSAVAVKADMSLVALGTDTGGSVRQPASFCGIIGLKPTYSRVSRYGLLAYASSFDVIGIFSHTIEDTALVLEIISGSDEYDATCSKKEREMYTDLSPITKKRIAYIEETIYSSGLDRDIKNRTMQIIDSLKIKGYEVEKVHFPYLDYMLPIYYILTTAEASSNLARYDGVKYGYSLEEYSLEHLYKKTRSSGFGYEVQRRILLGTFVLSSSYNDTYYIQALKARRIVRDATRKILEKYDFIILPTTPTPAFKQGERTNNPVEMYLADLFTVQASVCGIPAISLPLGEHHTGLPFGIQIMADIFKEKELISFSQQIMENKSSF
ncbi:MAG: Asp-tRNA(Asn)/Glu-tRNA(Gln) amidotransferase subunit GatA [Chitinophagaceae bacterium]|nr:Asp-tRNA(Asn)/Glu-tRNA(Gln) amidotransferase subunit GatA [Chitinophagaceae bacterium]